MKHLCNIIVLFVFAIASIGVPLHKHFCHGKVIDIGITAKKCFSGEKEKSDCCSDETTVVGFDEQVFQKENILAFDIQVYVVTSLQHYTSLELKTPVFLFPHTYESNAPPEQLFAKYSQRLFYS